MKKISKMKVKGFEIYTFVQNEQDYVSLTDIARFKDRERTDYIIQNWMRNRDTIEFLGIWEKLHNPNFKPIEFDGFRSQAGLNSFSLTPQRWIQFVKAIGLITKAGRYGGGTFAHQDIAFEFASWISPEFKLYVIKEFQRLKNDEQARLDSGWEAKRMLSKINYRIHTDAIKNKIILPRKISKKQSTFVYASEADVLNVALFGMTALEWRKNNKAKVGNIRDYADVYQLVCLANLESINAELIKSGLKQSKRLAKLNQIAIGQIQSLTNNPTVPKLLEQ